MSDATPTICTRRLLGVLCAMALVVSACSGGDAESSEEVVDEPTSTVSSGEEIDDGGDEESDGVADQPAPPTTQPRPTVIEHVFDEETGELVEVEVEARGPSTYVEVLDFGIEGGLWDEAEGLRRVLGHAIGAIPGDQVPGVDEILTGELSGLLARANELAIAGNHTEQELADLRRWYELAVPSNAVLEMLVTGAGGEWTLSAHRSADDAGSGLKGAAAGLPARSATRTLGLAQASADCAPVDPADFSGWALVEGCYELLEDHGEGVALRVLYPQWYRDDPTLADLPILTLEALVESTATYKSLGEVGDMTVLFSAAEHSPVATPGSGRHTLAVATVDAQWGTATVAGACPITIFPLAVGTGRDAFQQTIAHEAWHCVQHYSGFPQGVAAGTAWFHEAGAEYFSNVVYPSVNDEHAWLGTFDSDSRTTALFEMSYEAWIWWQFIANRESPRAVADMHLRMSDAGDGGIAEMNGYGPVFQRFVVEYVAGSIKDQNGANIPQAGLMSKPMPTVGKNDAGKVLEFVASSFVAVRHAIAYDKELRVFQSDQTQTNGEFAMVEWTERADPDAWRQVYPEVRSSCKDKTYYVVVATTATGTHQGKVQIDRIEEASCDPCVLGSWELDLATFGTMIKSAMAAEGGSLPPGSTFEFSGHYYTSMNDQGVMREQRDGLVATIGSAQGSISFTIDSFAEGNYTADGERMAVFDVVQYFVNVTTSIPGFGGSDFGEGSSVIGGALGEYECRTDDMTMIVDGLEPIRWIRIDKILQPPTTIAP